MVTKEELEKLVYSKTTGTTNLEFMKKWAGPKVLGFLSKNKIEAFTSEGFNTNSWDGSHFLRYNIVSGKVVHDCSVALIDGDYKLGPEDQDRFMNTIKNVVEKIE